MTKTKTAPSRRARAEQSAKNSRRFYGKVPTSNTGISWDMSPEDAARFQQLLDQKIELTDCERRKAL